MRGTPLLSLLSLLVGGCAVLGPRQHEASERTIERSFAPHRDRSIQGEPAVDFLRRRTAMLVGGPATLTVDVPDGRITPEMQLLAVGPSPGSTAVQGAAAAISADGYFLTVTHALAGGPVHLLLEIDGEVRCAPARVVWSRSDEADIALLHAPLRLVAWFELMPDRLLPAGEELVSFGHLKGAAAGEMEIDVDLPAFVPYEVLRLPHDMPMRGGFSGSAAVTLDGLAVGVNTSTGMDTILKRRTFLSRASPELVLRLVEEDRKSHPSLELRDGFEGDAQE